MMNNPYYSPQQTLSKQSSQIITPLPAQQANNHNTVIRTTLTDRSQQDLRNSYILAPAQMVQSHIIRESSVQHLH
jgi:hypothetical protein